MELDEFEFSSPPLCSDDSVRVHAAVQRVETHLHDVYQRRDEERGFGGKDISTAANVLSFLAIHPEMLESAEFEEVLEAGKEVFRKVILKTWAQQLLTKKVSPPKIVKKDRRKHDAAILTQSGIRQLRKQRIASALQAAAEQGVSVLIEDTPAEPSKAERMELVEDTPAEPSKAEGIDLEFGLSCYVCKQSYKQVHGFYERLCPACGDISFQHRVSPCNLDGKIALVTGARVKIGYHVVLRLLRAGCRVYATTRFPVDASERYAREEDFQRWRDRLHICQSPDFRDLKSVTQWGEKLAKEIPMLHIFVQNAAQTLERPAAWYSHLFEREKQGDRHEVVLLSWSPRQTIEWIQGTPSLLEGSHSVFPVGVVDSNLEQVDLRSENSWTKRLGDIPVDELLSVHAVNALAPFILLQHLRCSLVQGVGEMPGKAKGIPLRRHGGGAGWATLSEETGWAHVLLVSAIEGQFSRNFKSQSHPHSCCAKASLNMLCKTTSVDLAVDHVFVNAVDTGWVSDQMPLPQALGRRELRPGLLWEPPLDEEDGATRVLFPVWNAVNEGNHAYGYFFKDFEPAPW